MKTVNHRKIRLISEDMVIYDATIECELVLPKLIVDSNELVYSKNKMIFGSSWGRTVYSQVLAARLSEIEILDLIDE